MVEEIEFCLMEMGDLKFFNKVRSESYKYLHDQTNYTYEDNVIWFIQTKPKYYIVSVKGLASIGYIRTSNWSEDEVTIGMDIAEEFRGNGLGSKAYREFIDVMKSYSDIRKLNLEVLDSNDRAIHIYEKLGFVEKSRYKFNDTTDSIKMTLEI